MQAANRFGKDRIRFSTAMARIWMSEDTVAIVKQVFVPVLQSNCLTQLLQRPGGTGMGGDIAMDPVGGCSARSPLYPPE
jgi:hypothetical protein